jgi:hypothetical protein
MRNSQQHFARVFNDRSDSHPRLHLWTRRLAVHKGSAWHEDQRQLDSVFLQGCRDGSIGVEGEARGFEFFVCAPPHAGAEQRHRSNKERALRIRDRVCGQSQIQFPNHTGSAFCFDVVQDQKNGLCLAFCQLPQPFREVPDINCSVTFSGPSSTGGPGQ